MFKFMVVFLSIVISSVVHAEDIVVKAQKAVKLANQAIERILKNADGEIGLRAVTDPQGKYVVPDPQGDLYVFIYNMKGWIIAHLNKKLVGKNLYNLKDKKGKNFVAEFTDIAKSTRGEGWSSYYWAKPGTVQPAPKLSFIKRLPRKVVYLSKNPAQKNKKVEEEIFLGVGFYLESEEVFRQVKLKFIKLGYKLWEEKQF